MNELNCKAPKLLHIGICINSDYPNYELFMDFEKIKVMKKKNTMRLSDSSNELVFTFGNQEETDDFEESVMQRRISYCTLSITI